MNLSSLVTPDIETLAQNGDWDSIRTGFDDFEPRDAVDILSDLNDPARRAVLHALLTAGWEQRLDQDAQRTTQEFQRLGGSDSLDGPYLQVRFRDMIRKRGGWLSVLFVGEMLTATAMGYFEHEIQRAVVLALFVPLIISSGGNAGSQATSLVIRSLAVGDVQLRDVWRVLRRELTMGLALGSLLGLLGMFRILVWPTRSRLYGDHYFYVALTVSLSLIGVVLWGTLCGSMLPFLLRKLGFDPAAASAPAVATIVDVSGLVIYFTIASIVLHGVLL